MYLQKSHQLWVKKDKKLALNDSTVTDRANCYQSLARLSYCFCHEAELVGIVS